MDKIEFLGTIESVLVLGDLLTGSLALIGTKYFVIDFPTTDKKKIPVKLSPTDLLRKIEHFKVESFDKKKHYYFPLDLAAGLVEPNSPNRDRCIQYLLNNVLQTQIVRIYELVKSYCFQNNSMKNRFRDS